MAKRDVLDEKMARQFAWRTSEPAAAEAPAETPPAQEAQAAPEPEVSDAMIARAVERCRALAAAVADAWEIRSLPQQAAATQKLLRAASRVGLGIVRMDDHPLEAVRLWRLVVRHLGALRGKRISLFHLGFMPLSPRQSEIVDLLVEAAENGSSDVTFMLDATLDGEELGGLHPELGARLARLVDSAPTWSARARAARWLSLDDFPEAIPALQRALRQPHAGLRYCALFILPQMDGAALRPEDVMWLLDDAVIHPIERDGGRSFERAHNYEEALVAAIKHAAPAEGWRPLELIADGHGAHLRRGRGGLDSRWALRALAAGYPERALTRIDHAMLSPRVWDGRAALEAIGLLPDEAARPRLLAAAGHEDHGVAERAKELWFKRFGEECPVAPLYGVPLELLAEPPSERLMACLTVLRGASEEARNAMLEALVGEAPSPGSPPESLSASQREALALLLFSLRHGPRVFTHKVLPGSEGEWIKLLWRFGPPAFDGLASLSEPGALAGIKHGWLTALAGAVYSNLLSEPQKDRLRSIAVAALSAPDNDDPYAALYTLCAVGAPPELEERLWAIMLSLCGTRDAAVRDPFTPHQSVDALIKMRGAPGLGARAAAAAAEALQKGDYRLFDHLARLGGERDMAAIAAVLERAVAEFDGNPAAFGPVVRAAMALEKAGRLTATWLLERLGEPESPVFGIAANLARRSAPEQVRQALFAALESAARGGAAAAEAARSLVLMDALKVDDARLEGLLERAPPAARAGLAGALIDCGAPLSVCRHHLVPLLLSQDAFVTHDVLEPLQSKRPEGMDKLFEEVLTRKPAAWVRATMLRHLRSPDEEAVYWEDRDEDDEDDEVESDESESDEDELD